MSPLVQRSRPKSPFPNGSAKRANGDGTDQHWSMLMFESFSAGAIAVLIGMGVTLIIVGVFVVIVWPLTFWDGSHSGLEVIESWGSVILWSVFAGGTLAGFWCFSGAAFRGKPSSKGQSRAVAGRKSSRV